MIVTYNDDSFVTVHLGDFGSSSTPRDACWIKIQNENEWIRSPYNIIKTRELLEQVENTSELNFKDAIRLKR